MKRNNRTWIKKLLLITLILCLIIGVGIVGYTNYQNQQMNNIIDMSFDEALQYTLKDNDDAVITVGIIKDGQASFVVYGENGEILPSELHTYEIGSLTKTVTAALVEKALEEGKINLEDKVDVYIDLPSENQYPTVEALLTHTSGFESYYLETPMIGNFFSGENDFYGINEEMLMKRLENISVDNQNEFLYSNFGYATLGLVLENVYHLEYTELVNDYLKNDLGLNNTHITTNDGDLENYWNWGEDNPYLPAGGLTSNIEDMLTYAQLQLENESPFVECHKELRTIDATPESYKAMGVRMDAIGMGWMIDTENDIIWHNGGTDDYNCYVGFQKENQCAVVVLSNLSPNENVSATILGAKLLLEIIK